MKKYFVLLAAALLALAACEKTAPIEEPQPKAPTQLVVDFAPAYGAAPDTKAVKKGWEDGDVVLMIFEDVTTGYLKMTFDGTSWSTSLEGMRVSDLTASGRQLVALHFPFCRDMGLKYNVSLSNFTVDRPYYSWFMVGIGTYTVDVSGGIATLSMENGAPLVMEIPEDFVQFFIADADAVDGGASLCVDGVARFAWTPEDGDGDTGLYGASLPGYVYDNGTEKGYVFSGKLHKDREGLQYDYSFRLVKGLECKVATATGKTLKRSGTTGRAANITGLTWTDDVLKAEPMYSDGDGNVYYFASVNVGATSEEDYGAYFAWGEVEKNIPSGTRFARNFDWDAPYRWGSAENELTKYCPADESSYWDGSGAPDNKTVLEPDDDAAVVWLGGGWRMPTEAEWQGLLDNCDWTWTRVSGIYGYLVKGRGAYSTREIFLPAAGIGTNTYLSDAGYDGGYYWSSTLAADYPAVAWRLYFNDGNQNVFGIDRCYGMPVRPLQKR